MEWNSIKSLGVTRATPEVADSWRFWQIPSRWMSFIIFRCFLFFCFSFYFCLVFSFKSSMVPHRDDTSNKFQQMPRIHFKFTSVRVIWKFHLNCSTMILSLTYQYWLWINGWWWRWRATVVNKWFDVILDVSLWVNVTLWFPRSTAVNKIKIKLDPPSIGNSLLIASMLYRFV